AEERMCLLDDFVEYRGGVELCGERAPCPRQLLGEGARGAFCLEQLAAFERAACRVAQMMSELEILVDEGPLCGEEHDYQAGALEPRPPRHQDSGEGAAKGLVGGLRKGLEGRRERERLTENRRDPEEASLHSSLPRPGRERLRVRERERGEPCVGLEQVRILP